MTKFCGKVGYAKSEETATGVWTEKICERSYMGDVVRNTYQWANTENLNDDLNINNSISVIADSFAYEILPAIRYVKWMGAYWKVTSVDIQRPRLILTLGGVYNGPKAEPTCNA